MPRKQAGKVKLLGTIETALLLRHVLPKQAIGANNRRTAVDRARTTAVDNHQVITNAVEIVLVATRRPGRRIGDRSAVLVENLIAKFLQTFEVALVAGEADLEPTKDTKSSRCSLSYRLVATDGERSLQPLRRRADIPPVAVLGGCQFGIGQSIDPHSGTLVQRLYLACWFRR